MNAITVAISIAVAVASAPSSIPKGKSWLCAMDKLTGFSYANETWKISSFTADQKYIVKQKQNSEGDTTYHWTALGDTVGAECREQWLMLVCELDYQVRFNTETLRFQFVNNGGFVAGWDDNKDNPAIGIGRCAAT